MSDKTRVLVEEYIAKPTRVDHEKGILHDCLLLGGSSRNGVDYPSDVRARALPLLEGAKINLSHPSKRDKSALTEAVTWDRRIGRCYNLRNTDEGVRGDVRVLKKHTFTQTLLEAAEEMPDMFGFSPVMVGVCRQEGDGRETCVEIRKVRSIDIVTDPGTTRTLFEDEAPAEEGGEVEEAEESVETIGHEAALLHTILDEIEKFMDEKGEPGHTAKRVEAHLKHHAKMYHAEEESEEEEGKGEEETPAEGQEEEKAEEMDWSLLLRAEPKSPLSHQHKSQKVKLLQEEQAPQKRFQVTKPKSGTTPASKPEGEADWLSILRK